MVIRKLIYAFAFAYADCWFSYEVAHFFTCIGWFHLALIASINFYECQYLASLNLSKSNLTAKHKNQTYNLSENTHADYGSTIQKTADSLSDQFMMAWLVLIVG